MARGNFCASTAASSMKVFGGRRAPASPCQRSRRCAPCAWSRVPNAAATVTASARAAIRRVRVRSPVAHVQELDGSTPRRLLRPVAAQADRAGGQLNSIHRFCDPVTRSRSPRSDSGRRGMIQPDSARCTGPAQDTARKQRLVLRPAVRRTSESNVVPRTPSGGTGVTTWCGSIVVYNAASMHNACK